jgi:NitT/TauT family transport system substrate-binding protein
MALPWIAKETGIFARYGIDADLLLVSGTPRVVQSLIAGDFDYALVGSAAVMRARIENGDTLMLATSGDYFNFKVMAHPQSGIHTIADLRGKTVGLSQIGSQSHTFLRILLAREGIPLDEVNVLQVGGNPQAVAAMVTGNLDAAVSSGISVPVARQVGAVMVADGKIVKIASPSAALATTRRHIEQQRDLTLRFMRGYVEAIHYLKTHRDDTIRIMQQYMTGLSTDDVAYLYDEVVDDYKPLPAPTDESIQAVLDRGLDVPATDLKPSDFYDVSFLQEIERDGLIAELYK